MVQRRSGRRPTLEEVAARAGVGRGTVSRVVNKSPRVRESTRLVVEQAIAELGYVPNRAARALAGNRTDAIALVIPEHQRRLFAEPYFSDLIHGVGDELADSEMQLLLTFVRTDRERRRFVQYARAGRVDGVLLTSMHVDDPLPDTLAGLGVPTVMSGRRSAEEPCSYVDSDNLGGARAAVRHLIDAGRGTIATVTGPPDMYVAQCRLAGHRQALEAAGRPYDPALTAAADFTEAGGRAATESLLRTAPGLDAVFAASDLMALGALGALRAAGRRVPEDVAVVGFEDSDLARHSDPPLTTVRQPIEEMGRTMIRVLLEEIATPGTAWRHVILRTELVRRASA
jgi:DNA-binding LacI/PurR family transcriptional regulator